VALLLGGGPGLNQGVGAPLFRVFAGVAVNVERSRDAAAAPAPDPDLDKDGIPNEEDKCPLEGGDVVRIHGKFYGCPKRDSDGDRIPDYLDACPDVPGVASKDPALNGCPDPDRDHDGIPNDRDKCPDEPETYNGFQDADGCPDQVPVRVEVHADQIVVSDHINFDLNSDVRALVPVGAHQLQRDVRESGDQPPELRDVQQRLPLGTGVLRRELPGVVPGRALGLRRDLRQPPQQQPELRDVRRAVPLREICSSGTCQLSSLARAPSGPGRPR
jgi:Thrombospondin type 3 repeat